MTIMKVDAEIASCFQQYGLLTSVHIAQQLGVTWQQVSSRLRVLEAEGKLHAAHTFDKSRKLLVWVPGPVDEGALPKRKAQLERQLRELQSIKILKVPKTPYRTTFVNGVSPWEKRTE